MSLYLKYRPRDFDSLVGQEFIRKTLQTALSSGKIVSSYLLCGPRGTGKTTTARILAKGANCTDLQSGNPCNSCKNCSAILNNSLIDIIEIDAASHTGVDNIREIIERAQFQPTSAKYKVYIIDEVHMLSKGAFNALLKILEEPPAHVKFILATTETHKVPDTIISRCQRYDFKSINIDDIKNRLQDIADLEGVKIDNESLDYIADAASGGLRNAISLFEQLIEGNEIIYEKLIDKLGLTDVNIVSGVYDKLLIPDTSVLQDISNISKQGKDMQLFYASLLEYSKKQALNNLTDLKINERIHILSKLNSGISELKHSFDPEVTIMTMLSQILGIYKEYVPQIIENQVQVSIAQDPLRDLDTPPVEKKQAIETSPISESPGISDEDIGDIFGSTSEATPQSPSKEEEEKPQKKSGDGFDSEVYITALRELKVKGALIISLKQARSFNLNDDHLEIVLQNNFTLKALNTGDNVLQLIKGLEQMGIEGKTVKLS